MGTHPAYARGVVESRCPRCGELMGELPPARSRMKIDRDLFVCSACGTDEALRDAAGFPPIEPSAWPVTERLNLHDYTV
ncbi:hypothetical protein CRH09_15500 [Nocardia terpenica]|uniref:Uncharacterized protein n=1 Tax=Nocardia terpenica TaxID=455432 RepID=A0A291RWW6_9NOCA|nr:hypothetical protein CRH09_15500 [Nocardia terpenica]